MQVEHNGHLYPYLTVLKELSRRMCAFSALICEDILKGLEAAIAFAILANNNVNYIKPVFVSSLVLQLSVWEA